VSAAILFREHARLACWFWRLAKTNFCEPVRLKAPNCTDAPLVIATFHLRRFNDSTLQRAWSQRCHPERSRRISDSIDSLSSCGSWFFSATFLIHLRLTI